MKIFEIRDSSQIMPDGQDRILGYLFYYDRSRRFYIELLSSADKWSCPALFYGHVKKKQYSIDHVWSEKWVRQRIIPAERQNISAVLRDNKLKEYDEYRLLILSQGRCAQDDCYIEKTDKKDLPEEIITRMNRKVRDVMTVSGRRVIVFFRDDTARVEDVMKLVGEERVFSNVLSNDEVFVSVKVSPGGNGIEWDADRFIPSETLYRSGRTSEFDYEDLLGFAKRRLEDTSDVSERFGVSRQYTDQLVKQNKLHPVITKPGIRVFTKAETEADL